MGFSERWDFRKLQQEATAKDTGEGSRWLVNDSSLTETQRDIIKESAKELGLIGIEIPSKNTYDFLWVLGGARLSCRLRPRLAAHLVTEHALHCDIVALLASGRPISLTERNATDTYAPNAKTEFDLINYGAEIEFNIPSSFIEERNDDAANTNKSWIIRRYDKTGSLPSIMSMCAPSSEPERLCWLLGISVPTLGGCMNSTWYFNRRRHGVRRSRDCEANGIVFRQLCWLHSTSVLKRHSFYPRILPVRSVFSRLLPESRSLQEGHGCPDHDGFSVCSPSAIRHVSRYDRPSPAMLLCVSEVVFRYAGSSTCNIHS